MEYGLYWLHSEENSRNVVVKKGYRNVWSKSSNDNFHMTFIVCVSAAKYVAPPLFSIPVKRLSRGVIVCYSIGGSHVTSAPKGFIDYTLFLNWIIFFDKYVPDQLCSLFSCFMMTVAVITMMKL